MSILNPEITAFLADIDYLVKVLNHKTSLKPKKLENISKSEGWGLTLVAYKKNKCIAKMWKKHLKKKVRKGPASLLKTSLWDGSQFLLVQINHLVSP